MSTKLVLITGLSLTVGLALPSPADAVTISAGSGCVVVSGVTCPVAGSSSIAIGSGSGSGTSTSPTDPFADVVDYATDDSSTPITVTVASTLTYDHVNGFAFGKTGGALFMVLSDTAQGIVLVPERYSSGSSSGGFGVVVDPSDVTTLATGIAAAPTGVVVDDLDGDGNDDIVAVDAPDQYLSVMFGKSDGTFAPAVLVPLASRAHPVRLRRRGRRRPSRSVGAIRRDRRDRRRPGCIYQ